MLPLSIFEKLSDEKLQIIITTLYYNFNLIPNDYLTPFLENKNIQSKIFDTLVYLCK